METYDEELKHKEKKGGLLDHVKILSERSSTCTPLARPIDNIFKSLIFRRYFGSAWIGVTYSKTKGQWVSVRNNSIVTYTPWYKSKVYNNNCPMMRSDNGRWNTLPCHFKMKFVCEKEDINQG